MKTMIEQLTQLQKENQLTQQDKMEAITAKNQQENNIISQLKQIVSEKEGKVKQLEQELVQLKQAVSPWLNSLMFIYKDYFCNFVEVCDWNKNQTSNLTYLYRLIPSITSRNRESQVRLCSNI